MARRQFKQRELASDEEYEELVRVGNLFWEEFSKLCAKHLAMMPPELYDVTKAYLGDKTSIYGSLCDPYLVYKVKE